IHSPCPDPRCALRFIRRAFQAHGARRSVPAPVRLRNAPVRTSSLADLSSSRGLVLLHRGLQELSQIRILAFELCDPLVLLRVGERRALQLPRQSDADMARFVLE